ncbi:MetQ/NlpA family ABC transporter substrate-binding protein [Oscillospiraceae bacterium LTW-04]|nr:MetQ/NlpA family ABC transporter substrate-binding protein [Oscillospiraceae bacterium MB24-C1]
MKKILTAVAIILALAACSNSASSAPAASSSEAAPSESAASSAAAAEATVLKIGATAAPHAEVLEFAAPLLEEKGITLEITIFDDYVLPNTALDQGDLHANYFQHQPYLDYFNQQNGTELVSAGNIHYEPLGVYPGKSADLPAIADGAQVAIPNDGSNEARALYLLETQGLIKVDHSVGYEATKLDVTENPKKLDLVELDADKIPAALPDVDFAVINGNYAIAAGVNGTVLITEDPNGESALTYANIIAVRPENKDNAAIKTLIDVLHSKEVTDFMLEKYQGSVQPIA